MKKRKNRNHKNNSNLIPGSRPRKPAIVIPAAWDTFCIWYKLLGSATKAASKAGYKATWGRMLLQNERIQARLKEIDKSQWEKALEDAHDEYVLCEDLLDKNLVRVVVSHPHEKRGYADVVSAIRHGNEVLGRVHSGTTINNQANAAVATVTGQAAFEVYKSGWLRRKEEGWNKVLEGQHSDQTETPAE